MAWARERIHAAIDAEARLCTLPARRCPPGPLPERAGSSLQAAALGGDYSRVAIGGASQGCCMALDAALTHRELLGGVFASFGHVYECTARLAPYPDGRDALLISAFHGAADECIAASLALRKYADLVRLPPLPDGDHPRPPRTFSEPSSYHRLTSASTASRSASRRRSATASRPTQSWRPPHPSPPLPSPPLPSATTWRNICSRAARGGHTVERRTV